MSACSMVDVPKHTHVAFRVFIFTCGTLEPLAPIFENQDDAVRYATRLAHLFEGDVSYQVRLCQNYLN